MLKQSQVIAVCVGLLLCTPFSAHAQSNTPAADAINALDAEQPKSDMNLDDYVYTYGSILKISDTEIVLQEYDYDSDEEKEVFYTIDSTTKVEGVASLKDIAVGDVVELYYSASGDKKTAKLIRKETGEEES